MLGYPMIRKTKVAENLAAAFDLSLISVRRILEARRDTKQKYGGESHQIISAKLEIPDHMISTLVQAELRSAKSQLKGWLLEGFPRSSKQLAIYESFREFPAFVKKIFILDFIL